MTDKFGEHVTIFGLLAVVVALVIVGFVHSVQFFINDYEKVNIRETNKVTWQLNDSTFKTYSCIRVQKVIK